MIAFPNCKFNLGLKILNKRADGFHNLETVFYPLPLKEVIEVIETTDSFEFSSGGLTIEGNKNDNLCVKAYELLKKDFPELPAVKLHLHKMIPMGAGLGGGSADGAFMLQLLNKKFSLGLSAQKLTAYALQLGSDCPFFLVNKPCLAAGRGEIIEPIDLYLLNYKFFLVIPGIHIKTGWAFSELNLQEQSYKPGELKNIISKPVDIWKNLLVNDFEEIVFTKHPEIKLIKEKLYDNGAIYASMSGSGSAVYGIFKKEINIKQDFPSNYFTKELIC